MLGLVTAIIKPHMLEDVKTALRSADVISLTVSEAQGFGRQGGQREHFRGSTYAAEFVPRLRVEVVVPLEDADRIAVVIADAARTGKVGDGKVWITVVERMIRIRTGEMGTAAV